jgi:hypothetical protein
MEPQRGMGMDGAHWGDLNGDGNDEMIMGMNGFGGLEALSGDGKKLWSASMANVWSQAIVPAAANRPALVLATDASGSVNVFRCSRPAPNSLRPDGGYFAADDGGRDGEQRGANLAFSGNAVEAFDQAGKTAWITSAARATPTMAAQLACAVMGDLKGDGTKQWASLMAAETWSSPRPAA